MDTKLGHVSAKVVNSITAKVRKEFRCFGGGFYHPGDPISIALAEKPAAFAAGVDVAEVVRFVLETARKS